MGQLCTIISTSRAPLFQLGGVGERCNLPQWRLARKATNLRFDVMIDHNKYCWKNSRQRGHSLGHVTYF